jgi:hypothetical protein
LLVSLLKNSPYNLKRIHKKAIIERYHDLNVNSGMKADTGEYNLVRSHNMRRFLNSTLLANGASIFFVDYLLGHELDATRAAYYRADPKALKEEYKKYIPVLTIEKALDPEQHPDFMRLKNESETYARAAANASVERNELIELRAEMEKMKSIDASLESLMEKKMAEMVEARINEILGKMK